jgi:hypothetical protein
LENTTGDVIIEDIRIKRQLDTDILFYTAQGSYKNNPEVKERLAFIERLTFQVGRETLLEKIEKVIELTLKKLLELNATRGLITALTSELDVEIHEMVMLLVEKQNVKEEALNEIVNSKVVEPMAHRLKSFWEKYDGFQNHFHRIDAVKKWEIFRDLLKPLQTQQEIGAFLKVNKTYQDDVIEIRNKFAHSKAEIINGKLMLKGQLGKEDFTFDNDGCVLIRRRLIEHKNSIENLKELLKVL